VGSVCPPKKVVRGCLKHIWWKKKRSKEVSSCRGKSGKGVPRGKESSGVSKPRSNAENATQKKTRGYKIRKGVKSQAGTQKQLTSDSTTSDGLMLVKIGLIRGGNGGMNGEQAPINLEEEGSRNLPHGGCQKKRNVKNGKSLVGRRKAEGYDLCLKTNREERSEGEGNWLAS